MPGRQSHGGPPSKKIKVRTNNKKRSINAFAIATQENSEKVKVKNHRLGETEGGNRLGKRSRGDENGGDYDRVSNAKRPRGGVSRGLNEELDIEAGSDSEGNEWRMGQVDSEDDSELDSDEAFGESDEDRFEGFAFSGSSKNGNAQKKNRNSRPKNLTLDENVDVHNSQMSSDPGDDDLGDGAVDLATMLDDADSNDVSGAEVSRKRSSSEGETGSDGETEEESGDSEEESFVSFVDENDDNDPSKIAALQNLIANLPQAKITNAPSRKRDNGANEFNTPSDFGVTTKAKLTLEDLVLPSIRDPFVKKSLKLLASESNEVRKRNGTSGKLEVPLAKRQQDRLDRSAAYDKSKETLDRWTDTIQHNRRADHLIFPLPNSDATANARLQPTTNSKPFNDLESTIQCILEESGLATVNGRDGEDKLVEFEELQSSKMSYEEVKARRDQLRMARELLFREEARAKRIKKIKSRSYRKVHRKQRAKEDRINKEALIEAGVEPSEDEKELQDRRRAEERMGSKHRGSKWSKATKQIGRAVWDEDARDGLTEMARRGEELRKRVEGKIPRGDGSGDSESSGDDLEEDSADDDQMQAKTLRKLQDVENSKVLAGNEPGSKLSNMKFMLKAEASRKRQNDEMVEQIRKELAGEESEEDEQGGTEVGRRAFRPRTSEENGKVSRLSHKIIGFEGPEGSSDDDGAIEIHTNKQPQTLPSKSIHRKKGKPSVEQGISQVRKPPFKAAYSAASNEDIEGGAWSKTTGSRQTAAQTSEARRQKRNSRLDADVGELDLSQAAVAKQAIPKKAKQTQTTLQDQDPEEDDSEAEDAVDLPFAIQDQELIKRAFAGADVVGEFEAEKRQTIQDEEEKVIDNTLPGWGSWVGDGLSKKDKRQNKGRFLTKSDGIKERDRKDAKLERVIINQKRIKKNTKYLASTLPFPFETRQQYERSLRLPVGPEWTTKETFQNATKPRILMKQGIIAPMLKPLL